MSSFLKAIYRSNFMRSIHKSSFIVRKIVAFLTGIYFGRVEFMRNKTYWRIYSIIKHFRTGYGLFNRRHIKHMSLPIETGIIHINPGRIEYVLPSDFSHRKTNLVEVGNWDLGKKRLESNDIYIALKKHFIDGVSLLKTEFFSHTLEQIDKGEEKWGCKTKEELNEKYRNIDELYDSILERGYMTQDKFGYTDFSDEVKVSVDRNGKFLLENGLSRLTIANILGVQKIPVIITKRHFNWARFRKEVYSYSLEPPKGAYQQVTHPDFQNIRFHRKEERWDLILKNIPLKSGSVLDIGSNWGYFCHKFEDLGFDCYAVENNYRWVYFLKKFRTIESKKFKIDPCSIFDIKRKSYDIVLALSIFHGFLRSKDLYDNLTKFLRELDMKFMFFEPHGPGEGHEDDYINFDEDEFVDYVIRSSCLSKSKLLGRNDRGRNLYLLS